MQSLRMDEPDMLLMDEHGGDDDTDPFTARCMSFQVTSTAARASALTLFSSGHVFSSSALCVFSWLHVCTYACCLQQGSEEFTPVVCNRNVLRTLSSTDVIICKWPKPLRWQFFKKILPDVSITKCDSCQKVVF